MAMQIVAIRDDAGRAAAMINVQRGFNCFSWKAPLDGRTVEILWTADEFRMGEGRPSGSGIPILFPFPGRIRGESFQFQGKTFLLTSGDKFGNAIHGFLLDRPWRVVYVSNDRVHGEFIASKDGPDILDHWPADFQIEVFYRLTTSSLECETAILNIGESDLPFGLGFHPYFRMPMGAAGAADDCTVTVPMRQVWKLHEMLPTGSMLDAQTKGPLASGVSFGEMYYDDVFSQPIFSGGFCTATIANSSAGCQLAIRFDDSFRECVVFNPPHREAVCIEPYTCCPNPFELSERGIDAGLRVLKPGESFQARYSLQVERN